MRRLRHTLEWIAFRATVLKWSILPERLAMWSATVTGLIVATLFRPRRKAVDRHLALAFPEMPGGWRDRVARESYAHLAREGAFLFRAAGWEPSRVLERVRFEGLDELREAVDAGSGAILLTGHLGNWEVAGAALAAAGVPLDVVGKGMANRRFEEYLVAARERLGMRVIDMGEAPKEVLRSLGQGRVVAIVGDQNAHRSGVFVPFFGRLASTARGTALFALRRETPVFLGIATRLPGLTSTYRATIRRLEYEKTRDPEADVRVFLERYMNALEDAVRETPEQYFWQHKRWKTRPPEELTSGG